MVFGKNFCGNLLTGDEMPRNAPYEVKSFARKIKYISSGSRHTFAIEENGTIWSVGFNCHGQLALGHNKDMYKPTKVQMSGIKKIFCGFNTSYFINSKGAVFSCGNGECGQLGQCVTKDVYFPDRMEINQKVKTGAGGVEFSLLLTENGEVFFSGQFRLNFSSRLKTTNTGFPLKILIPQKNEKILKLSASKVHLVLVGQSGSVYVSSLLSTDGVTKEYESINYNLLKVQKISCLKDIVDVRCGENFSIFLDRNGTAFGNGELKYMGSENAKNRVDKNGLFVLKRNVEQVECGETSTFLFLKNKKIWCGGNFLELGLGRNHTSNVYSELVKHVLIKDILNLNSKISWKEELYFYCKKGKYFDVTIYCNTET